VTGKEIEDSIYGDPRFDALRYQIAMLSNIESADVQERKIKKAAFLDKAAAQTTPQISATIVASTPISR